jgi:hypothetical protein
VGPPSTGHATAPSLPTVVSDAVQVEPPSESAVMSIVEPPPPWSVTVLYFHGPNRASQAVRHKTGSKSNDERIGTSSRAKHI